MQKEMERLCIPKVKSKTSLSDPETRLIAHSLKEGDKTEEEVRKRERKDQERGRVKEGSEGPLQAS